MELEALVSHINMAFGNNINPCSVDVNGNTIHHVGTWFLSRSNDGVAVFRVANEAGDVSIPMGIGYAPEERLRNELTSFADVLEKALPLFKQQ